MNKHVRHRWWLGIALLLLAATGVAQQSPEPEDAATEPTASEDAPSDAQPPVQPARVTGADELQPTKALNQPPGTQIRAGQNAAIIRIEGVIYGYVLDQMERQVDRAMDQGANVIVFDMDTPGGEIQAAIDIAKYIKSLPVPTVAWINDQAYSAGILIASACDEIIMSPSSNTGVSAPVSGGGQNIDSDMKEKVLAVLLSEFKDNARNNGYDYPLLHAMVELGVEVYLIEHPETGEKHLVNQVDYAFMVKGRDPEDGGMLRSIFGSSQSTVNANDAGVQRILATDETLGQWRPVTTLPSGARLPQGQVHNGKSLLALDQTLAEDIGLSRDTVATVGAVKQYLAANSVVRVEATWSEQLAAFLTNPAVRGILLLVVLVGGYMEMQAPGLGAPGAAALTALALLIGAPFFAGLAETWHLIAFLFGFLLLLGEIFVLPGFGILGISGLLLMLLGLALMVVPTAGGGAVPMPSRLALDELAYSVTGMLVGLIGGFVGFAVVTKYFDNIPGIDRLTLQSVSPSAAGAPAQPVSGDEVIGDGEAVVGATGRAATDLRPAGTVEFEGRTLDVVTQGEWIEHGSPVKVIEVRGSRIVVESA